LSESDYRGNGEFSKWEKDLKGNNDLLVLTKPEVVLTIHNVICFCFFISMIVLKTSSLFLHFNEKIEIFGSRSRYH
jgi:hypothetical protein